VYDGQRLALGPEQEDRIGYRVAGAAFMDTVEAGGEVAVHWGSRATGSPPRRLRTWSVGRPGS
jgi:hypothetical protein